MKTENIKYPLQTRNPHFYVNYFNDIFYEIMNIWIFIQNA